MELTEKRWSHDLKSEEVYYKALCQAGIVLNSSTSSLYWVLVYD
jgi:hypothetical protein